MGIEGASIFHLMNFELYTYLYTLIKLSFLDAHIKNRASVFIIVIFNFFPLVQKWVELRHM